MRRPPRARAVRQWRGKSLVKTGGVLHDYMQIRDLVVFGSNDELKNNLQTIANRLESVAKRLYLRKGMGDASRVYPRIARSTADQLELLSRLISEQIEITANVCRTVFEINVTFRFCLSLPERLADFTTQRGTDEISIWKAIKKMPTEGDQSAGLATLELRIEHLRATLERHGRLAKPARPSLREMAKAVDLESDYDCLYSLYSKYVHASAWFVLGERDHVDLPVIRQIMQIQAQLYATDTLGRLEELAKAVL